MTKMIYLIASALMLLSTTSTQINLTMDSMGRWRMPISTRLVSSGTEVNARVILDVHGHHDFSFRRRRNDPSVSLETAYSLIFDDNTNGRTVIPTGNFPVPTVSDLGLWNTMDVSIGVAFGSSFAQNFDRFILTPSGESGSGLLVLHPPTPEEYAFEGRWFHINSLNAQIPLVQASVVIGNNTAFSSAAFVLDSECDHTNIPQEAFAGIVGYLEQAGFDVVNSTSIVRWDGVSTTVRLVCTGSLSRLYITGLSASNIAQILPQVYFEMVSGVERFRLAIFPEDYIKPSANGHVITVTTYNNDGPYTIGTNLLRHLALQIDNENHRIGFAEPVDAV